MSLSSFSSVACGLTVPRVFSARLALPAALWAKWLERHYLLMEVHCTQWHVKCSEKSCRKGPPSDWFPKERFSDAIHVEFTLDGVISVTQFNKEPKARRLMMTFSIMQIKPKSLKIQVFKHFKFEIQSLLLIHDLMKQILIWTHQPSNSSVFLAIQK